MGDHRASRRQLLRGLLAGLFGCVCSARPAPPLPTARPGPGAARFPAGLVTQTTFLYDGAGCCIAVRDDRPAPVPPLTPAGDGVECLTTHASYG